MSWQLSAVELWLRFVEKPYLAWEHDFGRARQRLERAASRLRPPPGARLTCRPLGGLPAARVEGPSRATLLWLHGGAYCLGSPRTHAAMVAHLARRIGGSAVLPAYRLAPEHPFPAAVEDAAAAYRALLAEGVDPGTLVLGGDSAGGGLVFALLGQLGALGLPAPACVLAFSPWVDLTLARPSLTELASRESLLPVSRVTEIRDLYLAGADPRDPRASPLFADLAGAPPTLIQASEAEILRDDARALAEALVRQGVDARLELWPDTPHGWQLYQEHVPEADHALHRAAAFVRRRLGQPSR
ncbi:alpha/beta hydrolase [Amaricoccus solimangrovi]|uniref:Alpha/beta hydrolase n=1 Tax=Amaricoccus solimangrovi TaxID=2589815 RepID=A0A501WTZ2_9RHOB|nr:alpha/beta hydrolase [Amaricoccus solimangrovi]TPE50827.1 alpha/beta hydrolase [Amaricoccus solimangrovi]